MFAIEDLNLRRVNRAEVLAILAVALRVSLADATVDQLERHILKEWFNLVRTTPEELETFKKASLDQILSKIETSEAKYLLGKALMIVATIDIHIDAREKALIAQVCQKLKQPAPSFDSSPERIKAIQGELEQLSQAFQTISEAEIKPK